MQRQKNFTTRVKEAMEKSMWSIGFAHIRAFANDKKLTRKQNRAVNYTRRLFWERNCGAAFSQWRAALWIKDVEDTNNHNELIEMNVNQH